MALGFGKYTDGFRDRYGSVQIVHGGDYAAKSAAISIADRGSVHRARGIFLSVAVSIAIAHSITFSFSVSRGLAFAIAVSAVSAGAFALSTPAIAFAVTSDSSADFGGMFGN